MTTRKYVVQVHHVLYGVPHVPQEPNEDNTCTRMSEIRSVFRRLVSSAGITWEPSDADGYGGPFGTVSMVTAWDGTHGDPLYIIEVGPRGGIHLEMY